MDLFNLNPDKILGFFLTLFRVSILVFLLPFFGGKTLPTTVKAAMCLTLSIAIWPHLSFPGHFFPSHPFMIFMMLAGELILGMILGMIVHFIFAAVQTGGHVIGFQMGFAMVTAVDPMTGTQEAVTAHFMYMIAVLTFLVLNGHLMLLYALGESFKHVPPGGFFLTEALANQVMMYSAHMFVLAVKVAAPMIAVLFLIDLALGLVARAAPQMNVLLLGFPLKIGVGLFFLTLVLSVLALFMREYIAEMPVLFQRILSASHR